ncbi:hypothetical protein CHGG_02080 [Chaetomium globosum CBS 148.51]|uniref:Uncharacterized protein n=1 Tax=Chaetomium globosum (strain ATCC 6205 / CBS 148.51 / DSM 1962 / NBRC 6347 / NRRL 1970) TaxID=306901 RepID=Q2HCH4_CHAGB|nr:uncharacterized protein CHGG_02080 [Chaetomium globosum CBS 148.51]EAQ93845.1 hypothetical protein CHGG_02080 [Chaetomium globosum CBS 148.51]
MSLRVDAKGLFRYIIFETAEEVIFKVAWRFGLGGVGSCGSRTFKVVAFLLEELLKAGDNMGGALFVEIPLDPPHPMPWVEDHALFAGKATTSPIGHLNTEHRKYEAGKEPSVLPALKRQRSALEMFRSSAGGGDTLSDSVIASA